MSFFSGPVPLVGHRSRSFSEAPRPRAAVLRQKRSASRVDALLGDDSADVVLSKGFDLAASYRACNLLPPCQPVPLARVGSAPAVVCLVDRVTRGDFGISGLEDDASCDQSTAWSCRGCGATDRSVLTKNDDSGYTCEKCGAVDAAVSMVGLDRQKNCPRSEDKTIVADAETRDARRLAYEAIANGKIETSQERRKREIDCATGTRVARGVVRKLDIGTSQRLVETQAARDSREGIEGDTKFVRKRYNVLRAVAAILDMISPVDERVCKFLRVEAARVVHNGFHHARCCSAERCCLCIPTRSNSLLALCTIQKCLERLVCEDAGATGARSVSIGSIAPECSRQELLKTLDETMQMQYQGAGATQRAQVAAAVAIAMEWTIPEQVALPCAPGAAPLPPPAQRPLLAQAASEAAPTPLALPPPMLPSAASPGAESAPESPPTPREDDPVWMARNATHGAWRLANVRADVRQAATASLQQACLAQWVRTKNTLPMCILGVVMLRAAAIKLDLEDDTHDLLSQYCRQYQISPTTAREAADTVASMMCVGASTTKGVFGDGIF